MLAESQNRVRRNSRPGPLALVGSGEYLPGSAPIERALLDAAVAAGRPRRFVQLPTAAGLEGDERVDWWVDLGVEQAHRLDAEPVTVRVLDRTGASDPGAAALVRDAGLIYLSGGSPTHLAATLRGTPLWAAILAAWSDGAALAGCSAGAMVMAAWVPDVRDPFGGGGPGLGVTPRLRVLPHFDRWMGRLPAPVLTRLAEVGAGPGHIRAVGVDEDTALVHGLGAPAGRWEVHGHRSAWLLDEGRRHEVPAGSSVELPAPVRPASRG